jgi:hypothetical protein
VNNVGGWLDRYVETSHTAAEALRLENVPSVFRRQLQDAGCMKVKLEFEMQVAGRESQLRK